MNKYKYIDSTHYAMLPSQVLGRLRQVAYVFSMFQSEYIVNSSLLRMWSVIVIFTDNIYPYHSK